MRSCALAMVAVGVEAVARVDFGGHPARDDLEDLAAEGDGEPVHERFGARGAREARGGGCRQGAVDQPAIGRLLRGLEQKRRVGGGILRAVLTDGVDVAGVGDDDGMALQGVEQGHGGILLAASG